MKVVQTEHEFTLPRGFLDETTGDLHRNVVMRLASGRDDFEAGASPRVAKNPRYKGIEILSRVILGIGDVAEISQSIIRNLFAVDYYVLIEEFNRLNYANSKPLMSPQAGAWSTESDVIELSTRITNDLGIDQPVRAQMRAALVDDEILPWGDDRVRENASFRPYIVLSRVLTRLDGCSAINPAVVQQLHLSDLEKLWQIYNELNFGADAESGGPPKVGEFLATPATVFAGR